MNFDSFGAFLAMGGHGPYVWGCTTSWRRGGANGVLYGNRPRASAEVAAPRGLGSGQGAVRRAMMARMRREP
jgi:hypothetical protein